MLFAFVVVLLVACVGFLCWGCWRAGHHEGFHDGMLESADELYEASDRAFRMGYRAGLAGKEAALDQDSFLADRMGDLKLEAQRAAGSERTQ